MSKIYSFYQQRSQQLFRSDLKLVNSLSYSRPHAQVLPYWRLLLLMYRLRQLLLLLCLVGLTYLLLLNYLLLLRLLLNLLLELGRSTAIHMDLLYKEHLKGCQSQ